MDSLMLTNKREEFRIESISHPCIQMSQQYSNSIRHFYKDRSDIHQYLGDKTIV